MSSIISNELARVKDKFILSHVLNILLVSLNFREGYLYSQKDDIKYSDILENKLPTINKIKDLLHLTRVEYERYGRDLSLILIHRDRLDPRETILLKNDKYKDIVIGKLLGYYCPSDLDALNNVSTRDYSFNVRMNGVDVYLFSFKCDKNEDYTERVRRDKKRLQLIFDNLGGKVFMK